MSNFDQIREEYYHPENFESREEMEAREAEQDAMEELSDKSDDEYEVVESNSVPMSVAKNAVDLACKTDCNHRFCNFYKMINRNLHASN